MRAYPLVQAITAATALTLATASVVAAQTPGIDTRFPNDVSAELLTAVLNNDLDDADVNSLVLRTTRNYHGNVLGGKTDPPAQPKKDAKTEPPRGGFMTFEPFANTAAVTQAALDLVGGKSPDLVVIHGGDWKANTGIARQNPDTTIIDLNAPAPCLDANGQPDTSGACTGATPGNYAAMEFAVEEGAFLAGVVAARESRGGALGIISGSSDCLECDRYVTGFINGARSVEPEIEIHLDYISDDEVGGFSDEASARTYTQAFLDVYQPTVLLPVGRGATMGMIEAACQAGVQVIGAGIDISAERPDLGRECVMASITADVSRAIEEAMFFFTSGGNPPVTTFDLQGGGITVTDEWRTATATRVDTNEFYTEAEIAVRSGQVEPCPDGCGVFPPGTVSEDVAAAD